MPERELLDPGLGHRRDLRLRLARTQRLDGLQEEVERDQHVDEDVDADEGLDELGDVLDEVRAHGHEEQHDVEGGHDHEREARLVIGEVDEVDGLVQHVGQRAVPLPRVQRAVRVLERLLLLLAELRRELVDLPELLARLGRLDGSGGRRLARSFGRRLDVAAFAPAVETAGDGIRRSRPRPRRAVRRHPLSFARRDRRRHEAGARLLITVPSR